MQLDAPTNATAAVLDAVCEVFDAGVGMLLNVAQPDLWRDPEAIARHEEDAASGAFDGPDEATTPPTVAWARILVPGLLLAVSVATMLAGRRFFKPLAAVLVAGMAIVAMHALTRTLPCPWPVVTGVVAATCAALLVVCLLHRGIFLLGAAAFAITTHFVHDSLTVDWDALDVPSVQGRSLVYWIAMAASIVAGGVAVHLGRRQVLVALTSVAGGVGATVAIALWVDDAPADHGALWAAMAVLLSAAGGAFQVWQRRQARAPRAALARRRRRSDDVELADA